MSFVDKIYRYGIMCAAIEVCTNLK